MANLYLQFKSSMFAAMHSIHLYDPPRFYILLLLFFMLLVILVKAGIFDGDAVQCARMSRKCAGEPNSGVGPGFGVCAVEVSRGSEGEEELEIGIDEEEGTVEEVHGNYSDYSPRAANLTGYEDDKEYTIEEGDEDIEELNKRVEAYILKVRMGLYKEG